MWRLLVNGAFWRHNQRHQILDLLDAEDLAGPQTGHVRTRDDRLRVVDSVVDRLHLVLRELSVLAVLQEARAQRPEAQLLGVELVAGITVATVFGARRIVREASAVAALGQLPPLLPVAHQ